MARAIWSGAISFGLVNVPVKAFAAVRDHNVHFNHLEKGTGARVHYKKVSDKTGKEVSADDIESGYEVSPGHYVVFDPDELGKLRPRTTRSIDMPAISTPYPPRSSPPPATRSFAHCERPRSGTRPTP